MAAAPGAAIFPKRSWPWAWAAAAGAAARIGAATGASGAAATAEGVAYLAERQEEVGALIERLTDAGDRERRTGGAPISRAVGNLLSALWHRVQRDGLDDETLHKIADVLDEAAKKVERL